MKSRFVKLKFTRDHPTWLSWLTFFVAYVLNCYNQTLIIRYKCRNQIKLSRSKSFVIDCYWINCILIEAVPYLPKKSCTFYHATQTSHSFCLIIHNFWTIRLNISSITVNGNNKQIITYFYISYQASTLWQRDHNRVTFGTLSVHLRYYLYTVLVWQKILCCQKAQLILIIVKN